MNPSPTLDTSVAVQNSAPDGPTDGRTDARYLAFTVDVQPEAAAQVYRARFGAEPQETRRTGGCVLLGPIPGRATERHEPAKWL